MTLCVWVTPLRSLPSNLMLLVLYCHLNQFSFRHRLPPRPTQPSHFSLHLQRKSRNVQNRRRDTWFLRNGKGCRLCQISVPEVLGPPEKLSRSTSFSAFHLFGSLQNLAFPVLFDFALIFLPPGMQSTISKINPELLKTVIASSSAPKNIPPSAPPKSFSVPSTPEADQNHPPALPVYSPVFRYQKCFRTNEKFWNQFCRWNWNASIFSGLWVPKRLRWPFSTMAPSTSLMSLQNRFTSLIYWKKLLLQIQTVFLTLLWLFSFLCFRPRASWNSLWKGALRMWNLHIRNLQFLQTRNNGFSRL